MENKLGLIFKQYKTEKKIKISKQQISRKIQMYISSIYGHVVYEKW